MEIFCPTASVPQTAVIIVDKSKYETPEHLQAYHSQSGSVFEVMAVFAQGKNAGANYMMHNLVMCWTQPGPGCSRLRHANTQA
jgi:hypothetical protein